MFLVVTAITALSVIIGELVPKQIAMSSPEGIAARVAPSMRMVAKIGTPLVWFLDTGARLVLRRGAVTRPVLAGAVAGQALEWNVPREFQAPAQELLRGLFGLTRAEAEVARALAVRGLAVEVVEGGVEALDGGEALVQAVADLRPGGRAPDALDGMVRRVDIPD